MNSSERFTRRLKGEPVDRPPNFDIFMTFAAHFIGQPLSRYYQDCRVLVQANLAVREAFDVDILQAISDPYREAADLGLEVEFPEDGLPVSKTPLLVEPQDLARLKPPKPESGSRMSDRLEAVRLLQEQSRGEVPVMGWMEGALARLHICGDTSRILADMAQSGADIVDVDWMVDIRQAAGAFTNGPALCGNFDPVSVMLSGRPEQVREAVLYCLEHGGPTSISAAGCEIPDGTPYENLRAQAMALKEAGL